MDGNRSVRERIISILRKDDIGLTTVEIALKVGMDRHSVTKYIYQLLGEGLIYQRKVGTAKLCFLKQVHHGRKKRSR